MRKPLRSIIMVSVGLLLPVLAWGCYAIQLVTAEQRTINTAHLVKLGQARYEVDKRRATAPTNYEAVISAGFWHPELDSRKNWNPYQHRPVKLVGHGDSEFLGDFSYFVMDRQDHLEGIIVSYVPHRQGAKDRLLSIGGPCGNNYEFLARGITPQTAYSRLKQYFENQDAEEAKGFGEAPKMVFNWP